MGGFTYWMLTRLAGSGRHLVGAVGSQCLMLASFRLQHKYVSPSLTRLETPGEREVQFLKPLRAQHPRLGSEFGSVYGTERRTSSGAQA